VNTNSERSALASQISQGAGVLLEKWCELLEDFLVMSIDVSLYIWHQQSGVYELSAVRRYSKTLPHKIVFKARMLLTHDNVLDSYTELPIFVEPWLIRNTHPYFEFSSVSSADAAWTLMHI